MVAMDDIIFTKCLLICVIAALDNAAIVHTNVSNFVKDGFNTALFLNQSEDSLHVSAFISYSQTLHEFQFLSKNSVQKLTMENTNKWKSSGASFYCWSMAFLDDCHE